jgi:hypothetical protein
VSEQIQLEQQAEQGKNAEDLRQNPVYKIAMAKMRETCIRGWENSALTDQASREAAYFTLKAANSFEVELDKIIGSGAMASNALKQKKGK